MSVSEASSQGAVGTAADSDIDRLKSAKPNSAIHKYLQEIEAEEGGRKASISDAILA